MKLLQNPILCLSLLLFLVPSISVFAQSDPTGQSPATSVYAITNATIVQAPGKEIKQGTLVISYGVITAVGNDVTIPTAAEVIDGTGMYVYAGFIDGMSYTGATRPNAIERPENLFTPDPPNDYAGITPEISVKHQLNVKNKNIESMRELGFTISHTVPYGRMLPGSGSLIFLADKKHIDELLMTEHVSMYTQFVGAPGVYPNNTLGIMAKWRNLYHNADYNRQYSQIYASNPTGLQRPSQDRVLQAFYPVLEHTQLVFYNANELLEARRALRLQKELGFKLALGNVKEGWELIDELKQSDISVFLSLNIPEKPTSKEEKDKTEEIKTLEARRLQFYEKHITQFKTMNEQGIKFGFSTMEVTSSKIKNNLLSIIEYGLDSTQVLAALTTDAAELLGISDVAGTLEVGKIGNAVVSTGPYFQKNSNVKYVFVDGDKYEYENKRGSIENDVSEESAKTLIGTWNYTSPSPEGENTGTLIFSDEEGELTGIITMDSGEPDTELTNISFRDGVLTFDFIYSEGEGSVEIVVTGDIIGTEFVGEVSISAFNAIYPFTAIKIP